MDEQTHYSDCASHGEVEEMMGPCDCDKMDRVAARERKKLVEDVNRIAAMQDQPCEDYHAETTMFGEKFNHQCPDCKGWRGFCNNCKKDHHKGGWLRCQITALQNKLTP
jgi:hypothetical protein